MSHPRAKYRVAFTLQDYTMLAALLSDKIGSFKPGTPSHDLESHLAHTQLFIQVNKAISNIREGLKGADTNYVPDERRTKARREDDVFNTLSLGLTTEAQLEAMSEVERDAHFAAEEARLLASMETTKS